MINAVAEQCDFLTEFKVCIVFIVSRRPQYESARFLEKEEGMCHMIRLSHTIVNSVIPAILSSAFPFMIFFARSELPLFKKKKKKHGGSLNLREVSWCNGTTKKVFSLSIFKFYFCFHFLQEFFNMFVTQCLLKSCIVSIFRWFVYNELF